MVLNEINKFERKYERENILKVTLCLLIRHKGKQIREREILTAEEEIREVPLSGKSFLRTNKKKYFE